MPAWCTPTPFDSRRFKILPNAVVKRVPFDASLMASRCSLLATPKLASELAVDSAASCEKCTMYSGASPRRSASSTVPSRAVSTYS